MNYIGKIFIHMYFEVPFFGILWSCGDCVRRHTRYLNLLVIVWPQCDPLTSVWPRIPQFQLACLNFTVRAKLSEKSTHNCVTVPWCYRLLGVYFGKLVEITHAPLRMMISVAESVLSSSRSRPVSFLLVSYMFVGDSGPRCVLSFTLRDSPFGYINVSMWGKPDSVGSMATSFSIGDIGKASGWMPRRVWQMLLKTCTFDELHIIA